MNNMENANESFNDNPPQKRRSSFVQSMKNVIMGEFDRPSMDELQSIERNRREILLRVSLLPIIYNLIRDNLSTPASIMCNSTHFAPSLSLPGSNAPSRLQQLSI